MNNNILSSMSKDILRQIIKTKNVKAFNQFSEIELDGKVIAESYTGNELRVYNRGNKTHIILPGEMSHIQESALADAIESGAIFDDAEKVDSAANYTINTVMPIRAMANKSITLPVGLTNMTKAVIGCLDDECHARCDQRSIDNGSQFLKDVCRTGEIGNTVRDVVDDYFGTHDDEIPVELATDIVQTEKELRNVVLNSPVDSINDEDYEEVEIEEGFFSMLTPDKNAKLIYHLNTMNDIINDPMLPDQPKAPEQSLNALDECTTEAKQLSKIAEKCANDGKFDKRTSQMLAYVAISSSEMSIAADAISNPFIKQDDIMFNEPKAKEAVQKWHGNKETLRRILPQLIKAVEDGEGKVPMQEGFLTNKPKRLKDLKMRDTVAYISIEIGDIKDVNDQQILSGYTCSKLELTDFYLSCIDNNDPKYIVPHTRQQLVQFQNDLNRLLTQILKIRPVNRSDRTWMVNVNYPEGWRG